MPEASRVIVSCDLHDFFRQEVTQAGACVGVQMQPMLEYYIVHLLVDYSRRDDLREQGANEPLALLQQRAQEAPPAESLLLLKSLGDRALYIAGFFAESLERSLVDSDYYVSMGALAYQRAASLVGPHARHNLQDTYVQLARQFAAIVDVLNQVAVQSQGRSGRDTDLLRLYERYARTQNERTRRILQNRGLSVVARRDQEPVH